VGRNVTQQKIGIEAIAEKSVSLRTSASFDQSVASILKSQFD
jgi:hypothetical protein